MNFKSKNLQIIVFSLVGLLILGGVVAVLMLTGGSGTTDGEAAETTAETIDPALILTDKESSDVTSITVKNSLGEFKLLKTLNVSNEEIWIVDGMDIRQSLFDQTLFASYIGYLSAMTASSEVEAAAEDLAQYGLDKPIMTLTAAFSDGTSYSLNVGNISPTGSTYYVAETGTNHVFVYSYYKLRNFESLTGLSFIGTTITSAYDTETAPVVKKFTVTRTDLEEPIKIEALPDAAEGSIQVNTHTFTSPYSAYIDMNTGSTLLYSLFGLTAKQAAFTEVTDETKEQTGLDEPFCTATMLCDGVITKVSLGDAITSEITDEATGVTTTTTVGYYGICTTVPDVIYIFDSSVAIWATMKPQDYMSKLFLTPYIYDLESVTYTDSENDLVVKIDGTADTHTFTDESGATIDEDLFKALYQYFISARGTDIYVDEARGDLIATVTYTYDDKDTPADAVSFYKSDDMSLIIAVNGKNIFKTEQMYGTRLKENIAHYLAGEEIIFSY